MGDVKEHLSYDVFRTAWGWVGAAYSSRGLRRLVLPQPERGGVVRRLPPLAAAATEPWPQLRNAVAACPSSAAVVVRRLRLITIHGSMAPSLRSS